MMFDDLMAAGSREVAGKMAGRRCGRADQMEADEHMTDRYMYVSIRSVGTSYQVRTFTSADPTSNFETLNSLTHCVDPSTATWSDISIHCSDT